MSETRCNPSEWESAEDFWRKSLRGMPVIPPLPKAQSDLDLAILSGYGINLQHRFGHLRDSDMLPLPEDRDEALMLIRRLFERGG